MGSAEKLAKAIAKALGHHRSTKKGAALAKRYRELGPATLYRHRPGEPLREPSKKYMSKPMVSMIPSEPRGVYFAERLDDLPELINPGDWVSSSASTQIGKAKDAAAWLTHQDHSLFEAAKEFDDEGDYVYRYLLKDKSKLRDKIKDEFIRARLLPEARVGDFSPPGSWEDKLYEFRDTLKQPEWRALWDASLPDDWPGDDVIRLSEELINKNYNADEDLARRFTEWLRRDYDAVSFPDYAAGQDETIQTVLLNKGKAIGRKGDYYKLLSALGLLNAFSEKEEDGNK